MLFFLTVLWLLFTAPLSKSLEPIAPPELTLLASDGTPIARNGAVVEPPVEAKKLPAHVKNAFIAIEDRRFYSHWGIDPRGMVRAALANMFTDKRQGGSTITQQLAKFTFLTPEQSLTRKAREAVIAFWLEAWLTKDEILERYLSNAYFGDNVYGLRAASLHYFYRKPENLTKPQAAMLAGMLKGPSRYAPTRNYERAETRMRVVLAAMVEEGYLTPGEARRMTAPPSMSAARTRCPPAPILPTGRCPRRARSAVSAMPARRSGRHSTQGCNAPHRPRLPTRQSAKLRSPSSPCAPTVRWWRCWAAGTMLHRRSTG